MDYVTYGIIRTATPSTWIYLIMNVFETKKSRSVIIDVSLSLCLPDANDWNCLISNNKSRIQFCNQHHFMEIEIWFMILNLGITDISTLKCWKRNCNILMADYQWIIFNRCIALKRDDWSTSVWPPTWYLRIMDSYLILNTTLNITFPEINPMCRSW